MKKAYVNTNRCVACGACANECRRDAIEIHKGLYAIISEDKCVGCGLCFYTCPAGNIELKEIRNEN